MITLSSVEATNNRKCNSMLLIFHLSSVPHIPMNAINTFYHQQDWKERNTRNEFYPKYRSIITARLRQTDSENEREKTEDEAVNGLTRKKALLVLKRM